MIVEGSALLDVETPKIVSKQMDVFYNPAMKLNRDISVAVINASPNIKSVADPLASSGVRAIRILKECSHIDSVAANDYSTAACKLMLKNAKNNDVSLEISNKDANMFLLESSGFDYIDIDPFGTPNPFLDSAVKRISRTGILAITATDTAALCGTYVNACKRKYWALPLKNFLMHEIGLRILIRKVQLVGVQYDKALVPFISYYKNHYFRIFFKVHKGKKFCDELIKKHKMCYFNDKHKIVSVISEGVSSIGCGPLWIGSLGAPDFIRSAASRCNSASSFLSALADEYEIDTIGFIDTHNLTPIPRLAPLIEELKSRGIKASRTHFLLTGIKVDSPKGVLELLAAKRRKV